MWGDRILSLWQTTAIRRVIGKPTALLQSFILPFVLPSNASGESSPAGGAWRRIDITRWGITDEQEK